MIKITLLLLSCSIFANIELINSNWKNFETKYKLDSDNHSYCYKDEVTGKTLGLNIDIQTNPASVTKLFVTYWMLKTKGKNFRFETYVELKDNNLYIFGSNDPYFVPEHVLHIINKLNELGINKVNNIYFDKNLYFEWSKNPTFIAKKLAKFFNSKKWNPLQMSLLLRQARVKKKIRFSAQNVSFKEFQNFENPQLVIKFSSSPIYMHLKQMNNYSNNFMAQSYYDFLGGEKALHNFLYERLGLDQKEVYFETGSGLNENYVTCSSTIKLINALNTTISKMGLTPQDIMAVPSIDISTLKNRFKNHKNRLVAKTGTLNKVSTIAGSLYIDDKFIPFAIFNNHRNRVLMRKIQESLLVESFEFNGDPFPYELKDYSPIDYSLTSISNYLNEE